MKSENVRRKSIKGKVLLMFFFSRASSNLFLNNYIIFIHFFTLYEPSEIFHRPTKILPIMAAKTIMLPFSCFRLKPLRQPGPLTTNFAPANKWNHCSSKVLQRNESSFILLFILPNVSCEFNVEKMF